MDSIHIAILRKWLPQQISGGIDIVVNGKKSHFLLYNADNSPAFYCHLSEIPGNTYIDCDVNSKGLTEYFFKYLEKTYPNTLDSNKYYIDGNDNLLNFFQYVLDFDGPPYYKHVLQDLVFFAELWTHVREDDPEAYDDAWCIVISIT